MTEGKIKTESKCRIKGKINKDGSNEGGQSGGKEKKKGVRKNGAMARNRMVNYTDIRYGGRGKMQLLLRRRKCEAAAERKKFDESKCHRIMV